LNNIKKSVDDNHSFGQFILTGSVIDKTISKESSGEIHTRTGRIVSKMMRPMSLFERGVSNGKVSLLDLKDGKFEPCFSNKTIEDYAYYICLFGWTLAMNQEEDVALQQEIDFYDEKK
jgi:hypothetical protein